MRPFLSKCLCAFLSPISFSDRFCVWLSEFVCCEREREGICRGSDLCCVFGAGRSTFGKPCARFHLFF